MKPLSFILAAALTILVLNGCVERFITVTSKPAGAIVWLNDEEVGVTPVTVPFTWYGDYEVVLRKDGYQTLKTWQRAAPPFYEWPGIDFVSECLIPLPFIDKHQWELNLEQKIAADPQPLIERAKALETQALQQPLKIDFNEPQP